MRDVDAEIIEALAVKVIGDDDCAVASLQITCYQRIGIQLGAAACVNGVQMRFDSVLHNASKARSTNQVSGRIDQSPACSRQSLQTRDVSIIDKHAEKVKSGDGFPEGAPAAVCQ
ncbi:unknown [Clostridium sp. CAG:1024]|nr:unknown [Clostridium sp. CAG:1024]